MGGGVSARSAGARRVETRPAAGSSDLAAKAREVARKTEAKKAEAPGKRVRDSRFLGVDVTIDKTTRWR